MFFSFEKHHCRTFRVRRNHFQYFKYCVYLFAIIASSSIKSYSFACPFQDEEQQEIPQLVQQLGSDEHVVRTEAHERLLRIGGPTIPFLRDAVSHQGPSSPDSEIRLRSTRLLILIERAEYDRKISEFLEGSRESIDLTGWQEFSAMVGNENVSRQLFVAMHEAQPDLMNSIPKGREEVEEQHQNVVRRRMYTTNYSNANKVLGNIASVVFVASLEFPSKSDSPSSRISISDYNLTRIRSLIVQPQMSTFIEGTSHKKQIDRLFRNWLSGFPHSDNKALMTKLEIIKALKLSDELPLVIQIANTRELHKSARIYALRIIESLGDESIVGELENSLSDQEVLGKYFVHNSQSKSSGWGSTNLGALEPIEVRFCDLALAVAVTLKKFNHNDFGYDNKAISNGKFVSNRAGFRSDNNRDAAFKLWNSVKD